MHMSSPNNGNGLKWFEKEAGRLIISQGVFAVLFVVLFAYVLWYNARQQEIMVNALRTIIPSVDSICKTTAKNESMLVEMRDDLHDIIRLVE